MIQLIFTLRNCWASSVNKVWNDRLVAKKEIKRSKIIVHQSQKKGWDSKDHEKSADCVTYMYIYRCMYHFDLKNEFHYNYKYI